MSGTAWERLHPRVQAELLANAQSAVINEINESAETAQRDHAAVLASLSDDARAWLRGGQVQSTDTIESVETPEVVKNQGASPLSSSSSSRADGDFDIDDEEMLNLGAYLATAWTRH